MKEFTSQDESTIKQAQLAILKNTSDLSKETRSKVFSRFQALKYYYISLEEAEKMVAGASNTTAFYSPLSHSIYIIKNNIKNNSSLPVIVHEMIHAVTRQEMKKGLKNFHLRTKVGVSEEKCIGKMKLTASFYAKCTANNGINEGLTEFFASEFLSEKGVIPYHDFVTIASLLCKECGYNKVKECFFNNDSEGLKKLIKKTFHLKQDYLVDKLLLQMDVLLNYNYLNTREASYGYGPIFSDVYKTFLKLKVSKLLYEHKDEIKSKFDVFKFLDIPNYLTSGKQFSNMRMKDDDMIQDLDKNKYVLLCDILDSEGYKNVPKFVLYFLKKVPKNQLSFLKVLNRKNPKLLVKTMQFLNSVDYMFVDDLSADNDEIISLFLKNLCSKDNKIDLKSYSMEEKYEFITNVMSCTFDLDPRPYTYFHPKDLVEYVSHGLIEYDEFYNYDAVDYLYDEIKKQNKEELFKEIFEEIYEEVESNRELLSQKQEKLEK